MVICSLTRSLSRFWSPTERTTHPQTSQLIDWINIGAGAEKISATIVMLVVEHIDSKFLEEWKLYCMTDGLMKQCKISNWD